MDMLLGLVDSLKLNNTIFVQFFVFLCGYTILYYVLFKPYNNAAQIRYERTTGSEESADQYDEEIELLKRRYGQKVKDNNEMISSVFSSFDEKAKLEAAELMMAAQTKYKNEKDLREKELEERFENEKSKVPQLTQDLKEQLKKVLAGA
jgi:F0F1-type ATP synthase membrane subunit b/b'